MSNMIVMLSSNVTNLDDCDVISIHRKLSLECARHLPYVHLGAAGAQVGEEKKEVWFDIGDISLTECLNIHLIVSSSSEIIDTERTRAIRMICAFINTIFFRCSKWEGYLDCSVY